MTNQKPLPKAIPGEFLCRGCMRWKPIKSRSAADLTLCGGCVLKIGRAVKRGKS